MATQSLDEETTKKVIRQVRLVFNLALYFNINFATIIVHSIFSYLFPFFFSSGGVLFQRQQPSHRWFYEEEYH